MKYSDEDGSHRAPFGVKRGQRRVLDIVKNGRFAHVSDDSVMRIDRELRIDASMVEICVS